MTRPRFKIGISKRRAWIAVFCAIASGCGDGGSYKDDLLGQGWMPDDGDAGDAMPPPVDDGGSPDASGPTASAKCIPASTAEPLPAREAVLARGAAQSGEVGFFTADLFSQFVDHCGSCHAGLAAQGTLNVNVITFPQRIGGEALQRIRSDDPMMHMPPPPLGKPFSTRHERDPLVGFASLLEQWIAAGRPEDIFYPAQDGPSTTESPYVLSEPVGMQMTNLGNCVPEAAMVATEADRADELDEKFEKMESFADLPTSLQGTDLFTLDAEELAKHGVVGFAPAYTLWADNAKKIRMIRVPRGKSVRFDPDTQTFDIPANTRVYKTFLKEVTDFEGNTRYRKIETRIIISRPDDGDEHTAIFGSYKWNEAETEATLQTVPYRDGTGFADDVFTYVQDEQLEDRVLREAPNDLAQALRDAGATRTYAIPGSDRCIHCHMGSPQKNFILGFLPLQLQRRPNGEGGVFEEAGRDELNQVQRLIDYGVITGMTSPDEITLLEDSQGERKPRNEHELKAQGYMVGNCAHCHNPRGFPSRREPVLADVLDFMPSDSGGVFQFPLDKSSPRIFRGESQRVPAPYISPSLYDMPVHALFSKVPGNNPYMQKWITLTLGLPENEFNAVVQAQLIEKHGVSAPFLYGEGRPLHAPWRSLIYRNVDSPFSYQDGNTVFPHMPMDTPGFDCRARQYLGMWMTSIPARWKMPEPEQTRRHSAFWQYLELLDPDAFPYEEVAPGAPDYEQALDDAAVRVELFQESPRYSCPDPKLDIIAPEVARGERTAPAGELVDFLNDDGEVVESMTLLDLPARPHYFKTDLRDDPVWGIRRSDWYEVLVENGVDVTKPESNVAARAESADALAVLSSVTLDEDFKDFALTPVPFGLWMPKAECSSKLAAAEVRTVSSIPAEQRPSWIEYTDAPEDAYVYEIAPGAQVFSAICSKCHGPLADGQSALAATIADLSGGLSRVANLRSGLFGPIDDPGANRHDITKFGRAEDMLGLSVDQWAARYVAWMGMSGTNATIPSAAVAQIGAAVVLGQPREANIMAVQDASAAANMLSAVKAACELLLPRQQRLDFDAAAGYVLTEAGELIGAERKKSLEGQGLILKNGDADLWRRLCNYENPAPIRVFTTVSNGNQIGLAILNVYDPPPLDQNNRLYHRSAYPAGAEIGFGSGVATAITDDNTFPWCVQPNSDADLETLETIYGRDLPRCPDALFAQDTNGRLIHALNREEVNRWALRGAANAGMAVFAYLDAVAKGEIKRLPAYDRCEQLE